MCKLKSYRKKSQEEIPVFRVIFGHLRDPNYIAPTDNKWRKDESDSNREYELVRLQKFVPIWGSRWFIKSKAELAEEAEGSQKSKRKHKRVVKIEHVTPGERL